MTSTSNLFSPRRRDDKLTIHCLMRPGLAGADTEFHTQIKSAKRAGR